MKKIKMLAIRSVPYFIGAGSLLDFANDLGQSPTALPYRSSLTRRSWLVRDDWQHIGQDLAFATREIVKITRR